MLSQHVGGESRPGSADGSLRARRTPEHARTSVLGCCRQAAGVAAAALASCLFAIFIWRSMALCAQPLTTLVLSRAACATRRRVPSWPSCQRAHASCAPTWASIRSMAAGLDRHTASRRMLDHMPCSRWPASQPCWLKSRCPERGEVHSIFSHWGHGLGLAPQ